MINAVIGTAIMIFQYTWPSIVTEMKTATRRVVKVEEKAVRGKNNRIIAVTHNNRLKWQVGATYAVQPARGHSQVARIKLTRITSRQLGSITNAEARAEGFANRQEFFQTWEAIHGSWIAQTRVWVIEFALTETLPALSHYQRTLEQLVRKGDNAYQRLGDFRARMP